MDIDMQKKKTNIDQYYMTKLFGHDIIYDVMTKLFVMTKFFRYDKGNDKVMTKSWQIYGKVMTKLCVS